MITIKNSLLLLLAFGLSLTGIAGPEQPSKDPFKEKQERVYVGQGIDALQAEPSRHIDGDDPGLAPPHDRQPDSFSGLLTKTKKFLSDHASLLTGLTAAALMSQGCDDLFLQLLFLREAHASRFDLPVDQAPLVLATQRTALPTPTPQPTPPPTPSKRPAESDEEVCGDQTHLCAAAAAAIDSHQDEPSSSSSSSSQACWCPDPSCSERGAGEEHREECRRMKEARDIIPSEALFWITYNTRLGGQGDRLMAEKLAARIRELGFTVQVIPHSDFEDAANVGPLPTGIINVPDSELPNLGAAKNTPLITIKEAGYTPDEQDEALGLTKTSMGMLLDLGLMSLYKRRLNSDPSLLIETFHKLSDSTRAWLSNRLNLASTSSDSAIRAALENLDLYFGYSAQSASRYEFIRTVMRMIRKGRTSLVAFAAEPDGTASSDIDTSYLGKISHQDFTLLLSLARYALVTGDRSLEEALSLGIPFTYEKLEHKRALALQLMALFQMHHLTRGATLSLPSDDPGLATFFSHVQRNYRLRDVTLLTLLQTLSSKKTYSIDAGMTHFELGKVYKLSIDEICQLKLASSGKVVDEAVRKRYGLTEDHRFDFESGGSGYYLLRLSSP